MQRSDDDLRDIYRRGWEEKHSRIGEPLLRARSVLRRTLWGEVDPYQGVLKEAPLPLKGPHQQCPLLAGLIADLKPKRILEVGAYYGAATVWMAECARGADPSSEVLTVDPWMGHAFAWTRPKWRARMVGAHDYFKRLVVSRGLRDVITYLPMVSAEAWKVAMHHGLKFQLAYIDGGHTYPDVRDDLALWSQVVEPAGVIVCDDYEPERFDGVIRAVKEFCGQSPWRAEVIGRKAVLRMVG